MIEEVTLEPVLLREELTPTLELLDWVDELMLVLLCVELELELDVVLMTLMLL